MNTPGKSASENNAMADRDSNDVAGTSAKDIAENTTKKKKSVEEKVDEINRQKDLERNE